MPLTDPLSIATSFPEKSRIARAGERSKNLDWSSIQAFNKLLPFSERHRNSLSLVLLIATVLCFWQSLAALYTLTQQQEHYSHILIIPWLSLYAFYLDRKSILLSREWSPWMGAFVIGVGAWWAWRADSAAYGADLLTVQMLAFVMMCWGIFLLCYGTRAWRTASFGLLFLLCMVPLPAGLLNAVIVFLQRSSAEVTDLVFTFLGVPFIREGFIFGLPNLTIHIAEECSGIRSTLSLVITSLVAGHFFLRSVWGKWALVAIVIPLAIVKNAFRIVGLSLLANYVDPSFITDSILHRSGGIPLFALSLVILLSLAWLIRRMERRTGYYSSDGLRAKV
jgi:exosortase